MLPILCAPAGTPGFHYLKYRQPDLHGHTRGTCHQQRARAPFLQPCPLLSAVFAASPVGVQCHLAVGSM